MSFILKNLIYFLIVYLVVFLVYALIINKRKKNYQEGKLSIEITYLVNKFDLDFRKTKYSHVLWLVTFTNSFIIAFVSVVCININKFIISLLVGFVLLMILIYSLYEIEGRILKRKENKK